HAGRAKGDLRAPAGVVAPRHPGRWILRVPGGPRRAFRRGGPARCAARRSVGAPRRAAGDAPRAGAGRVARQPRRSPGRAMLTPETVDAAARTCLDMHRTRARYRPLDSGVRSAPLDDAYRIQDALHGLMAKAGRGEIAGWKIALTSKAMQQMT